MRPFTFAVQNVSGWLDVGPVLGAIKAGSTGLLNLEGIHDFSLARDALRRISANGSSRFAIKLLPDQAYAASLFADLPDSCNQIVLVFGDDRDEAMHVMQVVAATGRELWVEVTSAEQARWAKSSGAQGLIAKGNEAGGRIGEETAFVLLQHLRAETDLPVWVLGGIGPHSAAACYAAGAAGVVLDSQVLLSPESTIPASVRVVLEKLEGEETIVLGADCGQQYRVLRRVGMKACDALRARSEALARQGAAEKEWRAALRDCISWSEPETAVWPLGQDAVFAASLARKGYNVSGILHEIRRAVERDIEIASAHPPLRPSSPLAQEHRIEFPILQGPMTRVSDVADFAEAVATNGALPFLALALLRGPQVRELLSKTKRLLGERSWGVGILGFVPPELRAEQLEVVHEIRPPFAIIAGGRPDQARSLDSIGISTYLHVPAPALLKMFLEDGARRFIFEGRECGGHVGPRTSFVLWEVMIATLLEAIGKGVPASELRIIFAGGIQDARSAAMVSAMAAPLVEKGVRIGVLMGTAYMFTREAVESGAVVKGFQQAVLDCQETVLLESGPGHVTRCAESPFHETFRTLRQNLIAEGKPVEEIKDALENLNLGRLRIASKGIVRGSGPAAAYEKIAAARQWAEGMYMIGQVAALRNSVCTMRQLHEDVAAGSAAVLEKLRKSAAPGPRAESKPEPCDVAIVGMSAILPQAPDLATFWKNLIAKKDAITEIPAARFDANLYYDQDRKAPDKIYSRWGGFLDRVPFDPMRYGIPPNALGSIDPVQLFSLVAVERALEDAAYDRREFNRDKASVILGLSGGLGELGIDYAVRSNLPQFLSGAPAEVYERLPRWTEDSFAGILLNVAAGRVANRFNLGGVNFAVDAACASSLAAVYLAVRELTSRSSEMVIVGGVDTVQSPFGFLCFSQSQALSPTGRCRPFDESSDGIAISEGVGMLVLKRLADAERDGDRIYAVIKGIAGSSDGRGRSMTAPRREGQVSAIRRAYAQASFEASSVGLIEAHGTGTIAGDETELGSLSEVFSSAGAAPQSCAVGSVKSLVGHTKAAAGVTGLMKVALALYHRVIPPTLHVERPNPKLREPGTPFYVNVEPQAWLTAPGQPRRAGVSSFGFGGTNFHAALEEYRGDGRIGLDAPISADWPAELFLWQAGDAAGLGTQLEQTATKLERAGGVRLSQLSAALCKNTLQGGQSGAARVAIAARSVEELRQRIAAAREHLSRGSRRVSEPKSGIWLALDAAPGKVAFLFPGQGSQYPGMLREAGLYLPELRMLWERADKTLAGAYETRLSRFMYPPPAFSSEERVAQMQAVTRTVVAQPALGVAALAVARAMARMGVRPAMAAGHSFGEYTALAMAGVFDDETLFRLAEARGRVMEEATQGGDAGTMAAVAAGADEIRQILGSRKDVVIANLNGPRQTIISGATEGMKSASEQLSAAGLAVRAIPVACAFHSPLMEPAQKKFMARLAAASYGAPQIEVYSNALGAAYPAEPAKIAELLGQHLVSPVRFVEEVLAMHAAGARVFVETGPKTVLSGLANQILEGREATVIATDSPETGFTSFVQALGHLFVLGESLKWDELFRGRAPAGVDFDELCKPAAEPGWWLTGARAFAALQPYEKKPPVENFAPASAAAAIAAGSAAAPPVVPMPAWPVAAPMAASGADAVMLQYQQVMAQFLQTQTAVITAFLQGGSGADAPMPALPAVVPPITPPPAIPVRQMAQPAPVLAPAAPVGASEPQSAPEKAQPSVQSELIRIASERTGYPADMLQLDANIEADLGIDSIKRVEILSALQRQLPSAQQSAMQASMEKLTRARTFGEMVALLPAAPAAAGPVGAPAASAPGVDVKSELIRIVSERTGYPADMLQLDANIEADLGIDSIKRVEILSALQRQLPSARQSAMQASMEKLTRARTLGEIISALQAAAAPAPAPEPQALPWFRLALQEVSSRLGAPRSYPGRVCVLTDDEGGVAEALAASLVRGGEKAAILRHSREKVPSPPSEGCFLADLTDPESVQTAVQAIRQKLGTPGALIHLLALRADLQQAAETLPEWRNAVRESVESLYLLARELQNDLEKTGTGGGALLAAVTCRGGSFGIEEQSFASAPVQFAVADFLKTLSFELSGVTCRVIDVDPTEPVPILRQKLMDELTSLEPILQAGRPGDRRLTVVPESREPPEPVRSLDPNWVIVLTGGARGITSQVARAIAARGKATLILVGASSLPQQAESGDTAGITDAARLKAALLARMRAGNRPVRAVEVEAAYQRLLRDREIRRTIADLESAGCQVEYHAVDVRDETAFPAFVEGVYGRHGRLDVFIHGAGIIEDRLIRDKTPESFERVVHTKADSAFLLLRLLRPEKLERLIFMSSITAAFGNRGQADYAAANGILNGIAMGATDAWRGKVVAMNWGPWDQGGMVSEEIRQQFISKGVQLIPPAQGAEAIVREMLSERSQEPMPILGGGPWGKAALRAGAPAVARRLSAKSSV